MKFKTQKYRLRSFFWILLIVCFVLIFILFQSRYISIESRTHSNEFFMEQQTLKGFLIKTSGCRIPDMDPFDDTVKNFIYKENRTVCNSGIPALVDSNLTSIFFVKSALINYTDQEVNALKCCYRRFYREEPKPDERDNKYKFDEECTSFNDSVVIFDEFIKVTCDVENTTVYTDFFSFVPIKEKARKKFEEKPLSVLIVGIDAVSRLNFHRQMPTAVEYLKNISAVEFLGYNKVGDNTYPNLVPVLTGLTEQEIEESCWTEDDHHYDNCSFIWKDYKKNGYVTSFGEDSVWMGIFNYVRKGFMKQPTDYMWGTFDRAAEDEIGNSHNMNVNECVGAREVYKVFLDYITNFVTKMHLEELPYFAFYWESSLSHDYLNKPNLGDMDYYKFFKEIKENGCLNNTVLIVMSDHGIRWGDIRQTYQGRMEERLPFLFVVLPEWYRKQYNDAYNNLLRNSKRLTTPFDLHETLKDLTHPFSLTYAYENVSKGYSLFSQIPETRTCEDAAISSHWCTCQQSIEVDKNDSVVVEAAKFAVDYMNRLLEDYVSCANLTLYNISDARVMTYGEHILNGNTVKDYTVVLETMPGEGMFETTLRYGLNNTFDVMGTISRLNLYGKQSACITDFHLKLYCYCTSEIF